MSNRRLLNYTCAIAGLLLVGSGVSHRVTAQATPPKTVKDTAKKNPVVSDQRLKIGKEVKPAVKLQGSAGGEVKLVPCPVDQDSVDRALAAVRQEQFAREQHARVDQFQLDSIVGAGASLEWGSTELFVESRFFQVKTDLAYHMTVGVGTYTSFTPIVVGLQFF